MLGVIDSVETRRFSVEEYHLMAEAGILGPDERIELIRGVVHTMSPKGRAHTVAGARVGRILDRKLKGRASVYPEASLSFPELSSEPQPDVVVCSSPDIDAFGTEASKPLLVVEVSHSSKRLDLGPKALLYAEAGIPEYWVVDLVDRVLVVFRDPRNGRYASQSSFQPDGRVTLTAWPDITIEVRELFPR